MPSLVTSAPLTLSLIHIYYGITFNHHRATDDAEATAKILYKMFEEIRAQNGTETLRGMNLMASTETLSKSARPYHTILLLSLIHI